MATPTPVSIELDAPLGCSDARAFYERLRARTDRVRPARPGDEPLRIEVKLVRVGTKVHGELSFKQDPSETAPRIVDGATCDEVVGVLSLTAAMALEHLVNPNAATAGTNDGSGASSSTNGSGSASGGAAGNVNGAPNAQKDAATSAGNGAQDKPPPLSPGDRAPFQPDNVNEPSGAASAVWRSSRPRFEFGGQVGFVELVSPLVAVGGGGLVRIRASGASLGLSASYSSNGFTKSDDGAEMRAVLLGLNVCPVSFELGARAAFEPCVLGDLGWMHLTDSSALNPRDADRSFWGAGALARLRTTVTPAVAFELEAGASFPLVKRRFVTEHPDRMVAETPWISPVLGLSAVVSP